VKSLVSFGPLIDDNKTERVQIDSEARIIGSFSKWHQSIWLGTYGTFFRTRTERDRLRSWRVVSIPISHLNRIELSQLQKLVFEEE
jgi:hypothetical protein